MDHFSKSSISANLLNTAFCALVINECIKGYNKSNKEIPYPLIFLVLPIVLHAETRKIMPRSTRTQMFNWLEENQFLKIDFGRRTRGFLSHTRDAVQFLLKEGVIEINTGGRISIKSELKNKKSGSTEVVEIKKKALFLGKWFSQLNDTKSIYYFWGIKP